MSDHVLVTGISGFVGGHVALELLRRGFRVRGSLRSLNRADEVRAMLARASADTGKLDFVALDLTSDAGWDDAMAGIRHLQHTASPFVTAAPRDRMELIGPAVDGTRRALGTAFRAGVERIVVTSSIAAIMYGHARSRTAPYTAADWTQLDGPGISAYTESKTRAEQVAWEMAEAAGRRADLVTINPGVIFGPLLGTDPGTSVGLLRRMFNGSLPAVPRIEMVVADVRDVAAAHAAAMTAPEAGGRRFPVGSATLTMMDMVQLLRRAMPDRAGKMPRYIAPDWMVRLLARFDSDARGNVAELGAFRRLDSTDARALLGRELISAEVATVDAARSLIAQGLA